MWDLNGPQKVALGMNLAKNTNAKTNVIPFHTFDGIIVNPNEYEDLNKGGQLETLANNETLKMVADSVTPPPQDYADYFNKLEDNEKCEEILKELGKDLKVGQGSVYQYNGKYWERLDTDVGLAKIVMKFFDDKGIKYNHRKIKNIVDLLMLKLDRLGSPNIECLGFNNGTLNKKSGELLSHKKENNLTSVIPIDYPESKTLTPNFDKWLEWVSEGSEEKEDVILASLYAIATTRSEWQFFFEISGCGGGGKSIFHKIALSMMGKGNAESLPLGSIDRKFGLAHIIDKPYLFSSDQEYFKGDGGTFRAIVSGDEIQIEQKNKDPITYTPKAIYVCITNSPIHFTERNGGIARRRVIIPFNRKVPDDQIDFELSKKLEGETGGILWRVLNRFKKDPEMARHILEKQRNSPEALKAKEQLDPLHSFANAFKIVLDPNKECLKFSSRNPESLDAEDSLYGTYQYWHHSQRIHKTPMDKATFEEVITQVFKEQGKPFIRKAKKINNTWHTNLAFTNKQQAINDWEN